MPKNPKKSSKVNTEDSPKSIPKEENEENENMTDDSPKKSPKKSIKVNKDDSPKSNPKKSPKSSPKKNQADKDDKMADEENDEPAETYSTVDAEGKSRTILPRSSIIVHAIKKGTSLDEVKKEFGKFGKIVDSSLSEKNDVVSSFIKFEKAESATASLEWNKKQHFGAEITVKLAAPSFTSVHVNISNISSSTKFESLCELLSKCGNMKKLQLFADSNYALAHFDTFSGSAKALHLDGQSLDGSKIRVAYQRPKPYGKSFGKRSRR